MTKNYKAAPLRVGRVNASAAYKDNMIYNLQAV